MEPPLNRSLTFLYLAVEDLYNEWAISGDSSQCCTLCDFHIGLGASLRHDKCLILHLLP